MAITRACLGLCKGSSAGLGLTASFLGVTRLLRGYYSSLSVSQLQSADASLDLTGEGTPLEPARPGQKHKSGLNVYLQRMTDSMLAELLHRLAYRMTELTISGE